MIAKIKSGSNCFGILAYHKQKEEQGKAKLIFTKGIILPKGDKSLMNIPLCLKSFEPYLEANKQTEKPVFHVSLNPHPGDEVSDEQMQSIAYEYMAKMGYGNQPYLLLKHHDIERTHYHIISLRIDLSGKKLPHDFEGIRSKRITQQIENKYGLMQAEGSHLSQPPPIEAINYEEGNLEERIKQVTRYVSKNYKFSSIREFNLVLALYNIKAELTEGQIDGKDFSGITYSVLDGDKKVGPAIKASDIGKEFMQKALERKFTKGKQYLKRMPESLRSTLILIKTSQLNSNDFAEFKILLKENNIDPAFRINENGRITGASFIDHTNGWAFNGSSIGKMFSANHYHDYFGLIKQEPKPIIETLSEVPGIEKGSFFEYMNSLCLNAQYVDGNYDWRSEKALSPYYENFINGIDLQFTLFEMMYLPQEYQQGHREDDKKKKRKRRITLY